MKKSIITEIFNGNRGCRETIRYPEEMLKHTALISDAHEELKNNLNAEQMTLHEKFENAINNYYGEEIELYFSEGFKLGLLIGIESAEE